MDCISVCLTEDDQLKPTDIIILQRDDNTLNDWHRARLFSDIQAIKHHHLWVNNFPYRQNRYTIVAVVRLYE